MGIEIQSVVGAEGIDSRPNPNVMAMVELTDGTRAYAMSPSGASTGEKEQHEKRDGDKVRYRGKGVVEAVKAVNDEIALRIIGMSPFDLVAVDDAMCGLDTTGNLSRIGANAVTAVSYAVAKAAAASRHVELFEFLGGPTVYQLPVPLCKFFDGGQHAGNSLQVQEFMWAPVGAPTFAEAMRWLVECHHAMAELLREAGHPTTVGDEGGFAPNLKSNQEALEWGVRAIEKAGFKPLDQIALALDPAASAFFQDGLYQVEPEGDPLNGPALVNYWFDLIGQFPVVSIEDGVAEKDFETWRLMHRKLGQRIQLIGDDCFCTNPILLAQSLPPNERFANSLLVKTNQIGCVSRAMRAGHMAHAHGMTTCVSQRSGDTEFPDYADIAVAMGSGFIKPGAVARSDRGSKYNRLVWIERMLGTRADYPGWRSFTSVPDLYARGVK